MGLRNMLSAVRPIGAAGDPPAYDTAAEVPLGNCAWEQMPNAEKKSPTRRRGPAGLTIGERTEWT